MGNDFILKMREEDKLKAKNLISEILNEFDLNKETPKEFLVKNFTRIKEIGELYSFKIDGTYDETSITIYFDDKAILFKGN